MMNPLESHSILIYDSKVNSTNHLVSTLESISNINKITQTSSMEEITTLLASESPSLSYSLFILTIRNEFINCQQPYGFQIFRIIRSFPLHKNTPIILISALQNDAYPDIVYDYFYDVWDIGFSSEYAKHSVSKALTLKNTYDQDFFYYLSRGQKITGFLLNTLIYINHTYRNATFYTNTSVIENMNISCEGNLENLFPFGFRRCNRFQIVNLYYIKQIISIDGTYKIVLKNCDTYLTIGKPFYNEILKSYLYICKNTL